MKKNHRHVINKGALNMSKKKKTALTVILIIAAVIVAVYFGSGAIQTYNAKKWLAEKYSWSIKDVKTISHERAKIKINIDLENSYINYLNEKWKCEYNGREFNVEYYDFHFADDYQLEDIFKWCTEWLQENVDPEIVGVEIFSEVIYKSSRNGYDYTLPWDSEKIFKTEDAEEILKTQKSFFYHYSLFYKVENINQYGKLSSLDNNVLIGNEKYKELCRKKDFVLSKNTITSELNIVLTSDMSFSRKPHITDYASLQSLYSIDKESIACF